MRSPIVRAVHALLIAEGIVFGLAGPPLLAAGVLLGERSACIMLACFAWSLAAPLVAFGDPGGVAGGVYGHLRRADEKEAAEMARLLEEHRP